MVLSPSSACTATDHIRLDPLGGGKHVGCLLACCCIVQLQVYMARATGSGIHVRPGRRTGACAGPGSFSCGYHSRGRRGPRSGCCRRVACFPLLPLVLQLQVNQAVRRGSTFFLRVVLDGVHPALLDSFRHWRKIFCDSVEFLDCQGNFACLFLSLQSCLTMVNQPATAFFGVRGSHQSGAGRSL